MDAAAHVIEVVPYLNRTITALARESLGQGSFTLIHLRVLAHIRRSDGCSLGDLAERRGVSLPTMSKMVSALVDKGLITREPDPSNRRAVVIRLTGAGDRLYLTVLARLQKRIADELAPLNDDERDELIRTLERLADLFSPSGEVRQHLHLPRDS